MHPSLPPSCTLLRTENTVRSFICQLSIGITTKSEKTLYSPPLTYYCTFIQTEVLPKSQWCNSSMFLTTTPSSHLLQGHVTILQNFLLSHPARKQLPSQGYMVKPSLHLSEPHDQSSPIEMLVMCVSSRPRAARNGWPLPSALAPFGLYRGI